MSGNTADSPIPSNRSEPLHKLARQLTVHNSKTSRLVSLPPELLKLVSFYLTDPLDLLRFSYTCHELFFLTAPADWYSLATYTYTNWVVSCGGAKDRDWKTMVLKDASLGIRLGYSLPPLSTPSSPATSTSLTVATPPLPSALPPLSSKPRFAFNTTSADVTESISSSPSPSLGPLRSQWFHWATNPSSPRQPSSLDESDRRRPLRVKLSEGQFFETDKETRDAVGPQWVRMGSPIYNIDRDSHTAIAASMITRPKSVPSKISGGDPRPHDHEILFYNLPDLTNPIARCGSDVWEKDKKGGSQAGPQAQPWYHPFTRDMMQVAQVVEIKHYPDDIDGGMRVVVVIAFGQRARPWVNNATDSHILGVWLMLKVIEIRVPVTHMTPLSNWMMNHFRAPPGLEPKMVRECIRIDPLRVVRYESLEPRQHQITMHGRIVKLYSAYEPLPSQAGTTGGIQELAPMDVDPPRRKVDCIAIFGTQNSDVASAMVIKKVLFNDDDKSDLGRRTYSNKAVSRGVSCMTLFPDHSGYEHLLVLFNQHGRGMVWDWVKEKQITQLHMPIDSKNRNRGNRRSGDGVANNEAVTETTLATAGNQAADAGVVGTPSPRRRVYYWGVQVSAALEVSFPEDLNNVDNDNNNNTFRIVTMADGAGDEWESCWWNITMDVLLKPIKDLPAPPIINRNNTGSNATNPKAPLISNVTRFERKTCGVCLPEQEKTHSEEHNKPIQFIAYVVWNHYRIGLSSRMGICMMDLEEPESGGVDQQWITFLEDREDLIDIAIFGHNLVVTLKTGHLVWSFYGHDNTPFVPRDGLGLRMDTGRSLENDVLMNRPVFVQ
ncbi:hypothetical protein BGZ96_010197 [Linnemannia gamsii]|uniref:F-box domain-containing protein n=1 Tax=Linnemannia gamsii TaxID=64522 RepID=A0ABQ7JUN9_9FUNG|nr:hypothetical protein BGZ96_010197 [Linnemannia gamsii]